MSLDPTATRAPENSFGQIMRRRRIADRPLVLLVDDNETTCVEIRQTLELSGYDVVDTDNGQEAAKRAKYLNPDLVVVDLDVPLVYELVAARQIVKNAKMRTVPIVIVTREDPDDPYPMMEIGVRRNEFVTRLSDHDQLRHLLDFLLPVQPDAA